MSAGEWLTTGENKGVTLARFNEAPACLPGNAPTNDGEGGKTTGLQ